MYLNLLFLINNFNKNGYFSKNKKNGLDIGLDFEPKTEPINHHRQHFTPTLLPPFHLQALSLSLSLSPQMTKFRKLNRPTGHRMSMLRY